MKIEFTTMIDDYNFSNLPEAILDNIKNGLGSNLLFERINKIRYKKPKRLFTMQYHWNLI